MRTWKFRGRSVGISLVRLVILFCVMTTIVNLAIFRSPSFTEFWISEGELPIPRYAVFLLVALLMLFLLRLRSRGAAQPARERQIPFFRYEFALLIMAMCCACVGLRSFNPFEVTSPSSRRAGIEQQLDQLPGEHLVLVKYSPEHSAHEEYVYNGADIDHSPIVWAREIPGRDINPLLTYFRNRDVWVLEPDPKPQQLYRYSATPRETLASRNSNAHN